MEDNHNYHNMKVHDNTIHHMVLTMYFSMHVQNLLNHLITLSGMSIDYSVIIFSHRFGLVVQSGLSVES